jgi:hypothetical protein
MRFVIAALTLATSALATSGLPAYAGYGDTITPTQALSNVGLCMTVEGRATLTPANGGRDGMQLTLDDGNGGRLVGYVSAPASLPDLNSLDGQTVDLTGVIQVDYGLPEIELNSPDYVWTAGNAPSTLVTCWASG